MMGLCLPRLYPSLGCGIFLLVLFSGCDTGASSSDIEKPAVDNVVVQVENSIVLADELLAIAKAKGSTFHDRDLFRIARITAEEIAAQRVLVNKGWDQDPEYLVAKRKFDRSFVSNRIEKEQSKELHVNDAELEDYFATHIDLYRKPAQVRVAIIAVSTAAHGTRSESLAYEIHNKLQQVSGAEQNKLFNEFVIAHSSHGASRFQGGDIGYVQKQDSFWPDELTAAIFKTPRGALLGPVVKTADTYYIFRVLGFSDAVEPVLADHKNRIYRKLLSEKQDANRRELRSLLVEGVSITINEQAIRGLSEVSKTEPMPSTPLPIPAG